MNQKERVTVGHRSPRCL